MVSKVDRMSALLLAKSIIDRQEMLQMRGLLETYVSRLSRAEVFSLGELSDISGMSEYKIKQAIRPRFVIRARSGIYRRHIDHLIRMVGDTSFARIHTKSLVEDGATTSALARVTGLSESSLRRWAREEQE